MACSYVYTGLTMKLTDGKRNLGSRTETLEEINLDAIGREDISNGLSKQTSVVAAVVTYYYGNILFSGECLEQIVGKTLCGHAHDVFVHTVCTGTHDAAQSACSELQVLIESVDEVCLVLIVEHCLYCVSSLLIKSRREPCLCFCLTLGKQFYVISHCFIEFFYIVFTV